MKKDGLTTTTITAAAATTTRARIGEVNANPTTFDLRVVQLFNGHLGLCHIGKSDETETTRAISFAITHHNRLRSRPDEKGGHDGRGWRSSSLRNERHQQQNKMAYVDNTAILAKGLSVGGRWKNEGRKKKRDQEQKLRQTRDIRRTWRNVSSLVFQLRLLA